MTNLLVIA